VILPPAPETPIIVTELLDRDLARHLRESESKPKVPFSEVIKIMLDVAEALHYLHSRKEPIVHRDLASKNVLLTKSMHAKIADLGLAKAFPHGAMFATAMPGTPVYAAPETYPKKYGGKPWGDKARYTEKIDIFSFGALMLETIIGHLPERVLPDPVLEGNASKKYSCCRCVISYRRSGFSLPFISGNPQKYCDVTLCWPSRDRCSDIDKLFSASLEVNLKRIVNSTIDT